MHTPHIPTEIPGQNREITPRHDRLHPESFYHSLAKSAKEAGHIGLAQRLTDHAMGLSVDTDSPQDPDWVLWDRTNLHNRHISPSSEFYERDRAMAAHEGIDTLSGYRSLDKDIIDRIVSQPSEQRTQLIKESVKDIEEAREDWLNLIDDESVSTLVRYGIADELAKQGHYEWPEQFDWQNQQCVADLNEKCTVAIKRLSTAKFYDFIEKHTLDYGEEAHKMEVRFVEYERDFRQKLNEFISSRTIPISRDKAIKRLEHVQICPLDQVTRQASEISGEYEPDTTNVYIVSGQDPEAERTTYFHERLHAISGITALFVPSDDGGSIIMQKMGLRIEQHSNPEAHGRFRWLDEAVTAELANNMSGYDMDVYSDEIKTKNLLLHGGKHNIPEKLLIDAYFENYEPDANEKIPAWKELYGAITATYGPRFLLRLDKIIQEDGIETGIEFIRLRQKRSVISVIASLTKTRRGTGKKN